MKALGWGEGKQRGFDFGGCPGELKVGGFDRGWGCLEGEGGTFGVRGVAGLRKEMWNLGARGCARELAAAGCWRGVARLIGGMASLMTMCGPARCVAEGKRTGTVWVDEL